MDITLYIGGQSSITQGEKQDLGGYRCFTAAYSKNYPEVSSAIGLLDSGAFNDPPDKRLTPEAALLRQLNWEARASKKLNKEWTSYAIASYDLPINEFWITQRWLQGCWSMTDTKQAVDITINAAKYLASQREYLSSRHLILGCQGVNVEQYSSCVARVLDVSVMGDWIGLGGFSALGRARRWLPGFCEILHQCIPIIAKSPVRHIHLYGVLWEPALATLLWICDFYGLSASCDSSRPILDCTYSDPKRAGVKHSYWRENVKWWQSKMANMRSSKFYREPQRLHKQLSFSDLRKF